MIKLEFDSTTTRHNLILTGQMLNTIRKKSIKLIILQDGRTMYRGQEDDADVSDSFLTPCMKPIRIGPERYGRGDGDGSSSAEQTEPGFHDPGGRP